MPKEYQYPVHIIARSYSEKVQHSTLGGKKFESSDFFSSRTMSLFSGATIDELDLISEELAKQAEKDVRESISQLKTTLQNAKSRKQEVLEDREAELGDEINPEEIKKEELNQLENK